MSTTYSNVAILCVDTNLLVEFVSLEKIPWLELVPTADWVRIVVPTKVGEEMDGHKSKGGRLRRRAIDFGQLARRIEDSKDGVAVLQERDPRITVEFGPLFRKSDLDSDQFELDDNDNRIVAEVLAISGKLPGATLLADDSKPLRLARRTGLPYMRPLSEWRRQEGPDERDTEIAELKREVGAQPHLVLATVGTNEQERLIIEDGPESAQKVCLEAFARAVLESAPKTPHSVLIERHGLYSPKPFDLASAFSAPGIQRMQLKQYDDDYAGFVAVVRHTADFLPKVLAHLGFTHHLEIDAGNDGTKAAERVLVEADLAGPFKFLPIDEVSKQLSSILKAPDLPRPDGGIGDLSDFSDFGSVGDHLPSARVDVFHSHDEPAAGGGSSHVSWRCEELRQDAHFKLPVLIVTTQPDAEGLLSVTASSAVLAKKTTMRIPLRVKPMTKAAGPEYFLQRLIHIPLAFREAFRGRLEELAKRPAGG